MDTFFFSINTVERGRRSGDERKEERRREKGGREGEREEEKNEFIPKGQYQWGEQNRR